MANCNIMFVIAYITPFFESEAVATCGCESLTMVNNDEKRVDVFEMLCRRRVLRMPEEPTDGYLKRSGAKTMASWKEGNDGETT